MPMSHSRRSGGQRKTGNASGIDANASSRVYSRGAAESPTRMQLVQSGRVRIAIDICGKGEAVVFLHGMGGDRSNWRAQMEYFEKFHLAISIDCRGYGDSGDYPGPFRYLDAARDVVAVLNACQIPEAHIVGLSMGGRIALKLYDRNPDRVRSLVLCSATARFAPTLS